VTIRFIIDPFLQFPILAFTEGNPNPFFQENPKHGKQSHGLKFAILCNVNTPVSGNA